MFVHHFRQLLHILVATEVTSELVNANKEKEVVIQTKTVKEIFDVEQLDVHAEQVLKTM